MDDKYIPGLFRIARTSRRRIRVLVGITYLVLAPIFVAFLVTLRGMSVSLAVILKGAAIGGHAMALGLLILSTSCAAYSYDRYSRRFMAEAKLDYPNLSEEEIKEQYLGPWFGTLQDDAAVVFQAVAGATLLAISTGLTAAADFA